MGLSLSKGASALLGRSSGGSTAAIVVPTTENDSVAPPATLSDEVAKQERLDAMYQWILTHSPGVHPEHAMEYARAFYSAKMATIGRLGVNVSRDPVLLAALGVAVDDAAELLDALRVAGFVGPYDPAASQWSDASTATASATASASATPYGNSISFRGLAASGRVLPSVKEHGSGRQSTLEVSVERDYCELCGASPAPPSATAPAPPSPLSCPQASAPPTPSSFPALPARTPSTCPVRPAAALRVVVQLLSVEGRVLCAGDAAGWLLFLPLPPAQPPRAAPTVGPQVAFDGQGRGRTMVELPGYATVDGRPGGPPAAFDGRGGEVCALLELADGRLCSGAEDGRVRVWDLAEHSFAATGAAAAAGGGGSTDRPHPAPAVTLAGHAGPVRALCETLSGCVVSGGRDRTIRCWDVATGACAAVLRCRGAGPVAALAPLLDPRHLCSAGADGALRLWAVGEGEGAPAAAPRAGRCVAAVAPAHDGAIFAALQVRLCPTIASHAPPPSPRPAPPHVPCQPSHPTPSRSYPPPPPPHPPARVSCTTAAWPRRARTWSCVCGRRGGAWVRESPGGRDRPAAGRCGRRRRCGATATGSRRWRSCRTGACAPPGTTGLCACGGSTPAPPAPPPRPPPRGRASGC